jgi:hypothetical protein
MEGSAVVKPARLTALFLFLATAAVSAQSNLAPLIKRTPQITGLNFATVTSYAPGGYYTNSVAAADVNGDGKPDIIVANFCASSTLCPEGEVGVLLNNGDGTFQTAVTYSSGGSSAASVAIADVNGDSKPDILVANICDTNNNICSNPGGSGSVGVLIGNGDGTFQSAVTYPSGGVSPLFVAVADVNRDGKPDIVVANWCAGGCSNSGGTGSVGVLLGKGNGAFQAVVTYGSGGFDALSTAVADLNGDGKLDIVVSNCSSNGSACSGSGVIGVLLGNGDGTFQTAVDYDSGGLEAYSVEVADLNGDLKPDLVVANVCPTSGPCNMGDAGVLLGNGDGTFQTATAYPAGVASQSVAVTDVNGDGKLDIVMSGGDIGCDDGFCDGLVIVLLGNGDGTLQGAVSYSSGGDRPASVKVADVNGDGKPDILVANDCDAPCRGFPSAGSLGVLINTSLTATTTTLTSSPNPSDFGQAITFVATVNAQPGFYKGNPTGTVSFFDTATATNLGTSSLGGSGTAAIQDFSLGPSTHSIIATYQGNSNLVSSASPAFSQVVLGAAAKFSPTSLAFGNQTIATSGASQSITLKNTGDIPLTFNSIIITGANPASFSQTNNCTPSIAGGGTCTISVTFDPKIVGTLSAALTFSDNAPSKVQKIPITGFGVLPAVTISPMTLDFPRQVIDTTSKAETVTVTNTGLGVLELSIALTGLHPGAFGLLTTTCGGSVNPGASCTISLSFTPGAIGTLTGELVLSDNAPASPQKVPLTGVGTAVQLSPLSVNFGNQPVGTTSLAKTITVSNKSHATVSITSIAITGANPTDFTETNTCGTSVASGASCFIKVKFKPSATGARSAAVSVHDNGGGGPQNIGLKGTGT